MQPDEPVDREFIENTLLVWECALCNGRDAVTPDLVDVWLGVMRTHRVRRREFNESAMAVISAARYGLPKPVDLLDAVKDHRVRMRIEARQQFLSSLVECVDSHGTPFLAPFDRVRDGLLLPEGATNPDAIDPRSQASLPGAPQSLPAELDRRVEMIRRMPPGAAAQFVRVLAESGADVSAEVQALRDLQADAEAKEKVDAEERDRLQAERIRAQVAAIRSRQRFNE